MGPGATHAGGPMKRLLTVMVCLGLGCTGGSSGGSGGSGGAPPGAGGAGGGAPPMDELTRFTPSGDPLLGGWLHVEDSTGRAVAEPGMMALVILPDGTLTLTAERSDRDVYFSSAGTYTREGDRFSVEFERLAVGTDGGAFTLEGDTLVLPFRAITDNARGDDGTSTWRRVGPTAPVTPEELAFEAARAVAVDAWYVFHHQLGAGETVERAAATAAEWLATQPGVVEVEAADDLSMIAFVRDGEPGSILLQGLDGDPDVQSFDAVPGQAGPKRARHSTAVLALPREPPVDQQQRPLVVAPARGRALIMAPFHGVPHCTSSGKCSFMKNWFGYPVPAVQQALEDAGFTVDFVHSGAAGVRGLWAAIGADYDLVFFISHGGFNARRGKVGYLMGDILGGPLLVTPPSIPALRAEFGDAIAWTVDGPYTHSVIYPGFIAGARAHHRVDFTDRLVYAVTCSGAHNASMRDEGWGTRFYVGYAKVVGSGLAYPTTTAFFDRLARAPGSTIHEAFDQGYSYAHCASLRVRHALEYCPCEPRAPKCRVEDDCPLACVEREGKCYCDSTADCPDGQVCTVGNRCTDCPCAKNSDPRLYTAWVGDCDTGLEPLPIQALPMLAPRLVPGGGDPCAQGFDVTSTRYATLEDARAHCGALQQCLDDYWSEGNPGGLADLFCNGQHPAGMDPVEAVALVNGLLCDDPPPPCEPYVLVDLPDR